jgi:hypothetical protein
MSLRLLAVLVALGALLQRSSSQTTTIISNVRIPAATENRGLSISVDLTTTTGVQRLVFAYRQFGESEYTEREMLLAGRTATLTLAADAVRAPYLEFYLRVEGDRSETYPLENAVANPARISVAPLNPKDLEVRVLSPEPGETVAIEELAIVVSLFYSSDAVNRRATRLYVDGIDVSRDAVLSEDIILYSPRNFTRPLLLGVHTIRVELYDIAGNLYHTIERSFNLSTSAAIAEQRAQLQLASSGQLEYRNEDVGDSAVTYARGDIRTNGEYRFLNFGATIHLDNQDKPNRQPQNRYLLTAEASIVRLQFGDAYPKFPSLIISGKRIRGLSANLALGFFNLDVSFGETKRAIEGVVDKDTTFADSSTVNARPKESIHKGPTYFDYTLFRRGTFGQNILAVRPSFGSGENFQLGFTYMKAKDDLGSIRYGVSPGENLVVGTDLLVAFDDQRFKFETQASFSLENTDITRGNFQRKDYEGIAGLNDTTLTPAEREKKKKDADDLERTGNLAQRFITVNENLFPGVEGLAKDPLPAVGIEAALTLNYFNNFIVGSYFRRGNAYKSFGNEFVQTDIQGFQISDRVRMLNNRVLLSISYERKSDNTANTKQARTTFSNLSTSVSVNPGIGWPTVNVGYGQNSRLSNLDVRKLQVGIPDSSSAEVRKSADDVTNRFFVGSSYDFVVAGYRNTATLTLNSANRTDQTFFERDQKNFAFQMGLMTSFKIPLRTTVSIGINQNESFNKVFTAQGRDSIKAKKTFNFTTIAMGAEYRLLDDALRLTGSIAPTTGDIARTVIQVATDYEVRRNHNVEFALSYIQNKGSTNDFITSLIYRFSF